MTSFVHLEGTWLFGRVVVRFDNGVWDFPELILGHASRVNQIELQVLGQFARPNLLRRRTMLPMSSTPMMMGNARVRRRSLDDLAALDDGCLVDVVRLFALHFEPLLARINQLD